MQIYRNSFEKRKNEFTGCHNNVAQNSWLGGVEREGGGVLKVFHYAAASRRYT